MDFRNTLEKQLKLKFNQGEIGKEEFAELHSKFKELNMLDITYPSSKRNQSKSFFGLKIFDKSTSINGEVSMDGFLQAKGNFKCKRLEISGISEISGNLSVNYDLIIRGVLLVEGESRVGSSAKISGKLTSSSSLFIGSKVVITGLIASKGELTLGGNLISSGKIIAGRIKSVQDITVNGELEVSTDIIASSFTAGKGSKIQIKGSLRAKEVRISHPKFFSSRRKHSKGIKHSPARSFERNLSFIEGNIVADSIFLNNLEVKGDVIGRNVSIGKGTTIKGKIVYSNYLDVAEDSNYEIEKKNKLII